MEVLTIERASMEQFPQFSSDNLCCYLCDDGQNAFRSLIEHFREFHYEGEFNLVKLV